MAHFLEARMLARNVCGQSCLHRTPAQRLTRELLCRRVNLPHLHRAPGLFEHTCHSLEHWAHSGGSRPRLTRIDQGSAEQLVVKRADPRELNLGSRV
jgi:hypothetical protein